MRLTVAGLAKTLGVCERTIYNIPEARKYFGWDKPSIEKQKPWEALGISRPTWYRWKKKNLLPEG